MRIEDLNARFEHGILVGDGAMGSLLHEALGPQRMLEELNSSHPDAVFRIHRAYMEAGAQIIQTNTFGANRLKLEHLGMGDRLAELNHRGVKIAREARESAKHEVLIAGSIGPLDIVDQVTTFPATNSSGFLRNRPGRSKSAAWIFLFLKRSAISMNSLAAIDAIRSFSRLPVVAHLTYSEEGTTLGGERPRGCLGKTERQEYSGASERIAPWVRNSCFRSLRAFALGLRPSFRHAQRGFPSAHRRPYRLSAFFAGIFCALCPAKRPNSERVFSAAAAEPRPSISRPSPRL